MNRKRILRSTAAILTASLLTTSLSGCHNKKATLEVSFEHSYASEKMELSGVNSVQSGQCIGDKMLLLGYDENYERTYSVYDLNTGSTTSIELQSTKTTKEHEQSFVSNIIPMSDGGAAALVYSYINYDDNGDYVYEDLGTKLEILDSDFKTKEVKQVTDGSDTASYYYDIKANSGDSFYATRMDDMGQQQIVLLDSNFKETAVVETPLSYVETMLPLKDGSMFCCYQDQDYDTKYGTIDPATNQMTTVELEGAPDWFNGCFMSKDDNYDYYLFNSMGLYGVDLAKGVCEEAVNWINSDFMGDHVEECTQLPDGRFVIFATDRSYQNSEMWKLSPRDPAELKNVKLISMASLYMPDNLSYAVSLYNRSQKDYRICVVDYSKYNTDEDYSLGQTKLENDMTSGIVADLIVTDQILYASFANKGLFLDLTDMASGLSEADYFTNFFDSLKYGNKLYSIGFAFNVNTVEAKTDHIGDRSGLSYAEFLDVIKNLPEGMEPFENMTKESFLYSTNIYAFVDQENRTCSYDSEEFIQLLELANTYPAADDSSIDTGMAEDDWAEQNYVYINDKVLFRNAYLYDVRNTYRDRFQYFDKAAVTRVGSPTLVEGSNGGIFYPTFTLAISRNSAYADECWKFIESMLTDDYQDSIEWSFPVKKSSFDKMAENAMKPETYIDENGNEVEIEDTVWRGDDEGIPVPPIDQAYIDELRTYLSQVKESHYYDEKIYNIFQEETSMFFAGDQDAKKTAEMIQSRVSLYLSEQS